MHLGSAAEHAGARLSLCVLWHKCKKPGVLVVTPQHPRGLNRLVVVAMLSAYSRTTHWYCTVVLQPRTGTDYMYLV